MASIKGLVGFAGNAAYNSAKHGVIGLPKVAALKAASFRITVNAICPGYVDTPLVRNQLIDLAKTRKLTFRKSIRRCYISSSTTKTIIVCRRNCQYVIFLAGEESAEVTGQAVVIDGGYTVQ